MSTNKSDSQDISRTYKCVSNDAALSILDDLLKQHPTLLEDHLQTGLTPPKANFAEIECRRWLDHSPVCTKIVDLDFNLQYMSDAGIKALDIDCVEDLYGKPYPFDFFPQEFIHEMQNNFVIALKTCKSVSGESPLSDIHGNIVWFHYTLTPVLNKQNEVVYFVVVSINTHDRKCAENSLRNANLQLTEQMRHAEELKLQAEQSNKLKGEFLANMSHEIRTPLTAILGFSDLLATEDSADVCRDQSHMAIRSIQSNADHLLAVVNDILDISKIEAGIESTKYEELNPAQAVLDVVGLTNPLAIKKDITLGVHFESSLPSKIFSDKTKIRQILLNLVSNGIKFTDRGGVDISVRHECSTELLTICVSDSGIGMTPEERGSIAEFKAFNQADGSTSRQFGGTGLGLKISNALAQMLGGGIEIDSTQGVGSTFTLTIQAKLVEGGSFVEPAQLLQNCTPSPTSQSPTRSIANTLNGLRVLVAEDGHDNQQLLSFVLKTAGAEVHVAGNGASAIKHLQSLDHSDMPHIVLMDLQMPVMDGYTATKQLRDSGFVVPIIALTAHAMEHDRDKCIAAGCNDYLTKPINKHLLIDTCKSWVNQLTRL
jgi:PAS domain S-box-containing protein